MIEKKYKNIVYIIGLTIVVTIGVQFYWNSKIYHINKQQLINQVQVSFDKAVDDYYNNLAKTNVLTFIDSDSLVEANKTIARVNNKNINNQLWIDGKLDSNHTKNILKIRSNFSNIDTLEVRQFNIRDTEHFSIFEGEIDTLKLKNLTTKIMFSFQERQIDLKKIDSLVKLDLTKKNIDIPYGFVFAHKNLLTDSAEVFTHNSTQFSDKSLTTYANSSFLPHQSQFKMKYKTSTIEVLSTMIGSILLSLLLSGIIISSLIFLLKIIFNQKQLSEIKNDLISNITHEFKTPIATISVALEGLQNFDAIQNPKMTQNYLTISNEQLSKLNKMVEKLLETASLKTNQFDLKKETIDVVRLIKDLVERHQFVNEDKKILFQTNLDEHFKYVDRFHFENALNNIIDNAIKYGGDTARVTLNKNGDISVEDNGNGIPKNQQKKIFEQFYRIPTGNVHNVKGFGIGLYYTKHIIEMHAGTVSVSESKKGKTVFKIVLPNGQ